MHLVRNNVSGDWRVQRIIGAKGLNECSASHYVTPICTGESIKDNPVDLCYSCQYLSLTSACQNRFFSDKVAFFSSSVIQVQGS